MQTRRASALSSLVLPHPQIPSRRSVTPHASSRAHTPLLFKFPSDSRTPRRSCDTGSWASSTQEADEMEWEWTKEQLNYLNKSIDALPDHILTPYVGPIPPPNLLDRLARSITSSKGAMDWPHSVKATRVKLMEICRSLAKSDVMSIPEEKENLVLEPEFFLDSEEESTLGKAAGKRKAAGIAGTPTRRRKPLYRQSSMDFLSDLPNSNSLARLSSRLQKTSKIINPNASYHPYARVLSAGARTPSPSPTRTAALNTIPRDRRPPALRRASSISTTSSKGSLATNMAPPSPTLRRSVRMATKSQQPMRLTRSATQPLPHNHTEITTTVITYPEMMALDPPMKVKLKRAPSYAASAGSSSARPYSPGGTISSDEEEKARSATAKRPRTRARTQSNGSTASGTTCVERDKAPVTTTAPEKKSDQEKDMQKAKVPVKKTKRAKTPEAGAETMATLAPVIERPSLEEPTPIPPVKVDQTLSTAKSPRLRTRVRPGADSTTAMVKSSMSVSDNASTVATYGQCQAMAAIEETTTGVAHTPADGTRSKSRSRSISPAHPAQPTVPSSPTRTLRRTTKVMFPKAQGQVLFGADFGREISTISSVLNLASVSRLAEPFSLTDERVRKERGS